MNYMDNNFHPAHKPVADKDVLAMAFVNTQKLNSVYDIETGFCSGTIFPCLDKPLMVRRMSR